MLNSKRLSCRCSTGGRVANRTKRSASTFPNPSALYWLSPSMISGATYLHTEAHARHPHTNASDDDFPRIWHERLASCIHHSPNLPRPGAHAPQASHSPLTQPKNVFGDTLCSGEDDDVSSKNEKVHSST
jgi:hypothetical protein